MEEELFVFICSPFCVNATMLNIIFIFCLCRPAERVSIQQPLYFLLIVVLGNSTIHQLFVLIYAIESFLQAPFWLLVVFLAIIYQTYCFSFSTCAWISIVYYLKIVPHHNKILIWIKKNINMIVFAGFVVNQVLLLSAVIMHAKAFQLNPKNSNSSVINWATATGDTELNKTFLQLSVQVFCAYFIFPIFMLSFSWGKTFYYLQKHINNMKQTTSSSKQQKNQMRVTIMGIVQTAVFIPSSTWAITTAILTSQNANMDSGKHITIVITSISGLANILCLGNSQSVFRVRIISVLKSLKKAFRQ